MDVARSCDKLVPIYHATLGSISEDNILTFSALEYLNFLLSPNFPLPRSQGTTTGPILSQKTPVHIRVFPYSAFRIHFSSIILPTRISSGWSLHFRFPKQNFVWISPISVCAICPTCYVLFNFIVLAIADEE